MLAPIPTLKIIYTILNPFNIINIQLFHPIYLIRYSVKSSIYTKFAFF